VTVTIAPDGGGSELLIRHQRLTRAGAIERHAEGWHGALDQLLTRLATSTLRAPKSRP